MSRLSSADSGTPADDVNAGTPGPQPEGDRAAKDPDAPEVSAPASDDTGEKVIGRDADAVDVEKPEGAEAGTADVAETAETGQLSDSEAAQAARETAGEPEEGASAPDPTPPAATAEAPTPPAEQPQPEPAQPEPEPEPEERDEVREGMLATLREKLGDGVVEHHIRPNDDLWVRVTREAWVEAGRVCRDNLRCDYFCFLSAIDWMPSPWGRGEDDPTAEPTERSTEVVQGVAGGETRFQVLARVQSTASHWGLFLKCDVPDDDLTMPTWVDVYAGADWHERETWEMYGISFAGHPNLTHIYLPGAFEGHPLRKDYPLLARQVKPWPGIVDVEPMPPGSDDEEASEAGETAGDEEAATA